MDMIDHYDKAENADALFIYKEFEAIEDDFFTRIFLKEWQPIFAGCSEKGRK
jgi:hypothetical protein